MKMILVMTAKDWEKDALKEAALVGDYYAKDCYGVSYYLVPVETKPKYISPSVNEGNYCIKNRYTSLKTHKVCQVNPLTACVERYTGSARFAASYRNGNNGLEAFPTAEAAKAYIKEILGFACCIASEYDK